MVYEKVDFQICIGDKIHSLFHILAVKNLVLPQQKISTELADLCRKKINIEILPYDSAPKLLIGQDHWELIEVQETRRISGTSLAASRSLLGWSIHGRVENTSLLNKSLVYTINSVESERENDSIESLVQAYFDLDSLGINRITKVDNVTKHALDILENSSRRLNKGWEIGLLWKENISKIPNSRDTALRRLELLERKLDRDPEYGELFYREMDRLIEKGFAMPALERLPGQPLWYLPFFGVRNPNKPGKVRLVFDAAAKSSGVSLNDLLSKGPDLLKPLIGVIMRFRQFNIAFKADLRDMFLKVRIREQDQNAQSFFWRGRDRTGAPRKYVIGRLLFGARSSPCEAISIKDKNAREFLSKYPEAAESVIENSYMDDYLDSCSTPKQAIDRIRQVIEINSAADWEMHGWACNDAGVLKEVANNSDPSIPAQFNINDLSPQIPKERVLGVYWITDLDSFGFQLGENKIDPELRNGNRIPTKREFLRIIMSVFDPLGFLSPFTIRARILMQEVWASKITWDQQLREREFVKWKLWIEDLDKSRTCTIPRCYQLKNHESTHPELHVFCDASEKAFAAVAYWRFEYSDGTIHVSMIAAKSRVAPVKPTTIPRLELQGAVIACRLAKTIEKEHSFTIKRRYFWSDSKTVLSWIKSDPRVYKTFVMNRLGEIREDSELSEWRWIPSELNPADDATRLSPNALNNNSRWLRGPSFLFSSETAWPDTYERTIVSNNSLEYKQVDVHVLTISLNFQNSLPDAIRISSWPRIIATTARVLLAIDIFKKRETFSTDLERYEKAEILWFKNIQISSFERDISVLLKSNHVEKNSKLAPLTPILDKNGILRVNGRVKQLPEINTDFKPVILDAKHVVSRLLILYFHKKFYHASHETVINELRQKFWILGLRKTLRTLINNCVVCRMLRGRPANPQMGNVPSVRLGFRHRPFWFTGLDYFGPMHVRVGRRNEKRWGAIFTCLTTRAIHIELAHSLDTDSAILALLRFSARRGFPLILYSDNGTNFRGAEKELKEALRKLDSEKQYQFSLRQRFVWRFNPPTASHMGGSWERMIRSIKSSLAYLLKDKNPREEVLLTTLIEIEHSINSRPLTHVSSDPNDSEALTPNHFLIGCSSGNIQFGRFITQNVCLRRQWKIAQSYADMFWSRWLKEYFPTLLPRKKWTEKGENLCIGDLVLILDDQVPRNEWRKGIVTQITPSPDGEVRSVQIRTSNGTLTRPSRKLIKLLGVQNT